jgi:prepilin-type N-terminal cleavage/methylation domain-containing protein/prepilin-type processing-associated H-X9-DG protein
MRSPHGSARRAFNLVELLVVIGIIGVLIALLFPAISGVRNSSRRATCASNLRQIGQLFYAYANDNHGELPAVYGGTDKEPKRPTAFTRPVADEHGGVKLLVAPPVGVAQQPYTNSARIFLCPGETSLQPFGGNADEFGYDPGWGTLPPAASQHRAMSYIYCYVPEGGDWFQQYWVVNGSKQHWEPGEFAGFERHNLRHPRSAATAVMIETTLTPRKGVPVTPGHHGATGNVLYLDGHVTGLRVDEVPARDPKNPEHPHLKVWLTAIDRKGGGL